MNVPGGKGQPACKADNLITISELTDGNYGSFNASQPYGPPSPVTGIALPFNFIQCKHPATIMHGLQILEHLNMSCRPPTNVTAKV
jgi:hypothetical protein